MTDHLSALVIVPVEGQSFSSELDWINRASRVLTAHPSYNNTEHGDDQGWRGPHFTALSFDQAGNRMRNGGDFKRATEEGTFPVWWVWPDQIAAMLTAAPRTDSLRDLVLEEAATICEDISSWGLSPTKAEVAKSTQTFCAKAIRAQKAGGA